MEQEPAYIPPEVPAPEEPVHVERAPISVVHAFCTRSFGADCQRCIAVCPHGALSLDAQGLPQLAAARCTSCGLCRGVCDAFCATDVTYADLLERARRAAEGGAPVYVTCAEHVSPGEEPAANVVVLPCLASVPPEFWTVLLREGIDLVAHVDFGFCETCFCAGPQAAALFSHAFELAESWTGAQIGSSDTYPLAGTIWDVFAQLDADERRGLIAGGAQVGKDIATGEYRKRNSGALADWTRNNERMRARGFINTDNIGLMALQANTAGPIPHERPRQKTLATSVQAKPEGADLIERWFAVTDQARCTRCRACLDACPTRARFVPDGEEPANPETRTRFASCIACGACMAACAADAIDFTPGTAAWFLEG